LVYQQRNWFVDVQGGARWEQVSVTDTLLGSEGRASFVIPYLGARVERFSLARNTAGGVSIETNLTSVSQANLDQLGRFDADDRWTVVKYDFAHSALLGPTWGFGDSLAHEAGMRVRGQQALTSRLIPNEQDVVGGAYSVRGYPESASAGDSTIVASFEYKYHVPRGMEPGEPGTIFGRPARTASWLGTDFRYVPQEPMGLTDWDLTLTGFFDIGRTTKNNKLVGETDHSLSSVGLGAEFQIRSNVSLKLDWGVALQDVKDGGTDVNSGDSRLHVAFTLLY
jgi:hemolysin activation/secretion protein